MIMNQIIRIINLIVENCILTMMIIKFN